MSTPDAKSRQKLTELVTKIWRRKQSRWPWPTGYLRARLPRAIYAATRVEEPAHGDKFALDLLIARLMANGAI